MARKTPQEQREKLLKQKQHLENRLKALDAKQTLQERKGDTRRKILVGAIVLHHAKLKPDFKKWLAGELNRSLDKPHDRALFEDWFTEMLGAQPVSDELRICSQMSGADFLGNQACHAP